LWVFYLSFFTKNPKKLIAQLFLWGAVFFCLPMLISSPEFVLKSYVDWYHVLMEMRRYALAGGFESMLVCDLVVAARNAQFGLPEVKRGLAAAAGGHAASATPDPPTNRDGNGR